MQILCDLLVIFGSNYSVGIFKYPTNITDDYAGADPGFQVRGGDALKKIAPSGKRCENFWGISCEKSRFYAKNSYFFQLRRETRKFLGVFCVKNYDFTPKNHIFFQF
jgi:hypothetical protein